MDIEEQYKRIYRYCYMKTRDHHTSEDLTQETFLHFLENHSYREIGKQMPGAFIGSWTFTDYRLTKVFGHYLNIFQMAPVAWMFAAVVVFLIAKMSYDRYQVIGR